MRNVLTIALLLVASVHASVVQLDKISQLNQVKVELSQIRNTVGSSVNVSALNAMQNEASVLAELIYTSNCNSYSINSVPNAQCKAIPAKFDAFMTSYQKFSQTIYLSRLNMMKQSNSWKDSIDRCVESLGMILSNDLLPENLFPITMQAKTVPYDGENMALVYEFDYTRTNGQLMNILKTRFVKWHNACHDVIQYKFSDLNKGISQGTINRYFVKQAQEYWKNSPWRLAVQYSNSMYNGIFISVANPPQYEVITEMGGKVIDRFVVKYDPLPLPSVARTISTTLGNRYMYIDNLPKDEIRFELGDPDQHAIFGANLRSSDETNEFRPISISRTIPMGNVTVSVNRIQ